MKETLKRTDVQIKLVLVVFFSLLYLLAVPYHQKAKQFPQLIAVSTLVILLVSLVKDFIQKKAKATIIGGVDDTELTTGEDSGMSEKRKRFFRAWGIILGSTALGFIGGFVFTTLFLFAGFAFLFGPRKDLVKNGAIALGLTVLVYFVFDWLMGVPMLAGLFW